MTSKAFTEITKLLEHRNLQDMNESYLDASTEKFDRYFNELPKVEHSALHHWLNSGERLANKINNFIFYFNVPFAESDVGIIIPAANIKAENDTVEWIGESYRECVEHYRDCETPAKIVVTAFVAKRSGHVEIHYRILAIDYRPAIGPMLWDEKVVQTSDALCNALYSFVAVFTLCETFCFFDGAPPGAITSFRPAPLFKYHPVRFSQTRDYIKQVPSALKSAGVAYDDVSADRLNIVANLATAEHNAKIATISLRIRRHNKLNSMSSINTESEHYRMYSSFVQAGKKIFDINPPLCEMFRETSVDAIPVSFLTSPFKAYFIHFGRQEHLSSGTGWLVDGVHVLHYPEAKLIQFLFTSCSDDPIDSLLWPINPEPLLTCVIAESQFSLSLGKAIDQVIDNRRAEMLARIAKGDIDRTSELQSEAILQGYDLGSMGVGKVMDIGASTAAMRLAAMESSVGTLKSALSLAVNSMCYLTAYPDDIDLDWAAETPRSMVERASKGHPNVKRNTESKLLSTGYQKVYLCGRKVTQGPITEQGAGVGGRKRTHWRRFHWRLQPYGPNRSLRKAIIIEAALINPGAGFDEEPIGTIYIDRNVVNLAAVKKNLKISSPKYWEGLGE